MKLNEKQLETVLRKYGHSFLRLVFVKSGYRNVSHVVETKNGLRCNFIVYKREDGIVERIRRVNNFSLHLRAAGVPVRAPLDTRIVQLSGSSNLRYGCLYSYEPGETIPWEAYSMKHIKLLGYALGKLHDAAGSYVGTLSSVTQEYEGIVTRMERYFADADVASAMQEKLGLELNMLFVDFHRLLDAAEHMPGQQALHMDFVRGNVLFRPSQQDDRFVVGGLALSGILDLEKAAYGHPLFDIARTLAFLLVDCDKQTEKIYKYFLQSGYIKRGGGSISSASDLADTLEPLVTMFLTYDFYKFLRQNPYESLGKNHHFIRTRDILVLRKVIQ